MVSVVQPCFPAGRRSWPVTAAAVAVTVLDGFDALSISLTVPAISRELGLSTASIGPVFATVMGGMAVGSFLGGALADRFGRLRILLAALAVFGCASLSMPLARGLGDVLANRLVSGIGLGAAAPIAVGLMNRTGEQAPSEFAISLVWSGVGLGGILAALFSYAIGASGEWRSIFVVGGLAPIPVAIGCYAVFRDAAGRTASVARQSRSRIADLFAHGKGRCTLLLAAMFLSGFITTSVIVSWLPTVLAHRAASPLLISASFAGINGGALVAAALLGWAASRGRAGTIRSAAWASAALCGAGAAMPTLGMGAAAALAVAAAVIGAGAQALSIAAANDLHREEGRQATSVGFMTGSARVGQFAGLATSGIVAKWGGDTSVFVIAAISASVAAALSTIFARIVIATDRARNDGRTSSMETAS